MSEVGGQSLAQTPLVADITGVARAAGHDAALINSVVVEGFGWLIRNGRLPLRAEFAEHATFVVSELPVPWPGWLAKVFCRAELEALEALVAKQHDQVVEQSHLAHGDLDVTHIYQQDGRYSGIIDFGEVRGADREFDLGHFLLHDAETRPISLFESFAGGYQEVSGLDEDAIERVRRSAILSGLRQLSLWLGPKRNRSPADRLVRLRVAQLRNLLDGRPSAADR